MTDRSTSARTFTLLRLTYGSTLPATARAVLAYLISKGDGGENIFPSASRIAADTGLTERCARTTIKHLESIGALVLVQPADYGRRLARKWCVEENALVRLQRELQTQPLSGEPNSARNDVPPGTTFRLARNDVPLTYPIPPQKNICTREPEGFAEFWDAYPKRVGKVAAAKAFRKAVKTVSAPELVNHARRFADHCHAAATDPQFIAHPATWLNQGRWSDELSTPRPAGARVTGNHPGAGSVTAWAQDRAAEYQGEPT